MKLTPPNLIHFSDEKLDELNTPFSHNLYDEDLPRGSYDVPSLG